MISIISLLAVAAIWFSKTTSLPKIYLKYHESQNIYLRVCVTAITSEKTTQRPRNADAFE